MSKETTSKNKDMVLIGNAYSQEDIQRKIFVIRGIQVILDKDLAKFYGVETRRINEQVKRNARRFPSDFMFQLTKEEVESLIAQFGSLEDIDSSRSQNATLMVDDFSKSQSAILTARGHNVKYLPYVFTEEGVLQLTGILHSTIAEDMSVHISRAFVAMRRFLAANAQVLQRLDRIEIKQLHESQEREHLEARFDDLLSRLGEGSVKPIEGIFYNGQIFDAYVFASDLVKSATKSIVLIDNYIDETVFTLLDKRAQGIQATIYTSIEKTTQLDIKKHNAQYQPIEVKQSKNIHDRFLIIDDTIYHIGASIKDLGKKLFAFSKMEMAAKGIIEHL